MSTIPLTREELQGRLARSPFVSFLGLELIAADPAKQELAMRMPMRPEFERSRGSGQWHGGPLAALIDTAGDYVLIMLSGYAPPTINFRVDYLRPAVNTAVTAVARVRRHGKSVGFVDIDLMNDAGALIAVGRANYATANPSAP